MWRLQCGWGMGRGLRVSDLARESRRKTEENVLPQRDCIQSLKTAIWDMNSLHGFSSADEGGGGERDATAPPSVARRLRVLLPCSQSPAAALTLGVAQVLRLLLRSPCDECWLSLPWGEGPCRYPPRLVRLLAFWFLLRASMKPEEKCWNLIWKTWCQTPVSWRCSFPHLLTLALFLQMRARLRAGAYMIYNIQCRRIPRDS